MGVKKWVDLTEEAGSVLEWTGNPFTGEALAFRIKVGEGFSGPGMMPRIKPILITEELKNEILEYSRTAEARAFFKIVKLDENEFKIIGLE